MARSADPARAALAAFGLALLLVSGEAVAPAASVRWLLQPCVPAPSEAPPEPAAARPLPSEPAAARPLPPAQQALAEHLARRFRIAALPAAQIVQAAYRAAEAVDLDPLLVLAVISIESSFNPFAESVAGAMGLMQIIPRFHITKLQEHGGEHAVLDPERNILVGARILQEYIARAGGLEAGLQYYNGASWDDSAKYARKVMAERRLLERAWRGALARIAAKTS